MTGDTLYALRRAAVKADLRLGRLMERLDVPDVSEDEVDEALDSE